MLKESILFIAATGALIYFITPSDEPAKPEPAKQVVQKSAPSFAEPSEDSWGGSVEEEEDYESFTFGEPMTDPDEDETETSDDGEDTDRPAQSDNSGANPAPASRSSRSNNFPNSPASGKPGSLDNPIIFKTNNPENPVDD
ncbi:hypothetical protein [Parasphingorhabdus sp.]|uniref:hypothetical protein n=1 Tax=Parasphingorhabdus sp. TaxID=2709688 RepID=UPI003A8DF993